uniref:NHL domain-containing protein n=1 Tax=Cephaloticoccus sp. TaxID=1985742 RepID=UPI0040498282
MKYSLNRLSCMVALTLAGLPGAALAQLDYSKPYVMSPLAGVSSIGHADGNGTAARFYNPRGITVDGTGNIYVADTDNQLIRKITAEGKVTTIAGSPGVMDRINGSANEARFSDPQAIVIEITGDLLVADFNGNAIRRIKPDGTVTSLPWYLQNPPALTIDGSDTLYLAQKEFQTIQRSTRPASSKTTRVKYFKLGRRTVRDWKHASIIFVTWLLTTTEDYMWLRITFHHSATSARAEWSLPCRSCPVSVMPTLMVWP